MDVKANLRHLRMSPRKVRLIVDVIRGMKVNEAETRLQFIRKDAALPVLKLLQSAIANAEHNFKLDRGNLFVKTIVADNGPTLKRFRPRAMGRSAPIHKRLTHVSIVLSDGKATLAPEKPAKEAKEKKAPAEKKPAAAKKPAAKKTTKVASETNA